MKYLLFLLALASLVVTSGVARAAPNQNNPQVVADYPNGNHGIAGEFVQHIGSDVVMRAGNSGNFQQWFYGSSTDSGVHGDHSVWMSVGTSTQCQNSDWFLVENASASWGDYLLPGNYCVHTNDYHPTK